MVKNWSSSREAVRNVANDMICLVLFCPLEQSVAFWGHQLQTEKPQRERERRRHKNAFLFSLLGLNWACL